MILILLWRAAGGLTGHSQVGVGLNFSRLVSGKALKHPRVVGQEAVDLQAAAHQHPVPGRLHRVDGQSILVPHDVRLRHSCTHRAREQSWSSSFPRHPSLVLHKRARVFWEEWRPPAPCLPRAWQGMSTTFSISAVMCLSGSLMNCGGSAEQRGDER